MKNLKRLRLRSLALLLVAMPAQARESASADYVITKALLGAPGSAQAITADKSISLAFALGEPVSGNTVVSSTREVVSGYFGGRFGNGQALHVTSFQIDRPGTKTFFQDTLRVGVPFDAPIQISFSDQLDAATIPLGVQVVMAIDHLGRESNLVSSYTYVTDSSHRSITILPPGQWRGNTFYDIQLTPDLRSVDGFPLDPTDHIYFVTLLNPSEDNVVLEPMAPKAASVLGSGAAGTMSIHIPTESLSDYSTVLLSRDPMSAPLHVDPAVLLEANEKARTAGGSYRVPVVLQEITAYNKNGEIMGPLSKTAEISISYSGSTPSPLRSETLSLWILDETHRLWVKIPASRNATGFRTVTAPVTRFSVFALMGSPAGTAAESFAFPIPWRPHGPNAGTGVGQTGTEAGGITFSNIPSECTITLYTLAGDRVRTLRHSDAAGPMAQETWDVKTDGGEPVASGIYLWRVESSEDGKNGKLMVIR